jgi:hypothetical protein
VKLLLRWRWLVLGGLVLLGLLLRLYGLNWDAGNNFHPDERQILFVVTSLAWPKSWTQFLNPTQSPLNPHFFAYGSLPFYLLALIGHLMGYNLQGLGILPHLTLVGRTLSALFDSGTIFVTGILSLVLAQKTKLLASHAWSVAWLAAALLAFTPLHLQLSHFYAVDTLLVFFTTLTILACVLYVEREHAGWWACLAGVAYGLALATKFSAAPLAVSLLVAGYLRWRQRRNLLAVIASLLLAALLALIVFIITQPYAFLDFPNYAQQVSEQGSLARGYLDFPYVRQFVGTTPYIYQIQNMVLWGMGLTLGCAALLALIWFLVRSVRYWRTEGSGSWLIVLSWIIVYGAISGSFFVKFMRYMLPIYPLLIVLAAAGLIMFVQQIRSVRLRLFERFNWLAPLLGVCVLLVVVGGTIFQGLALLNVYSQPNTRVLASEWIYQHIAPGSVLTYEQWDDALPVVIGHHTPAEYVQASYIDASQQTVTGLDLYGDDTVQKAQQIAHMLSTVDAIIMPTDRLDKSIPRSPQRYPLTIHYYHLLFSGQLGFRLAAQFENHPHLLGITLDDSNADESYSVFDHPHAHIFVLDHRYTAQELEQKLLQGVQLP